MPYWIEGFSLGSAFLIMPWMALMAARRSSPSCTMYSSGVAALGFAMAADCTLFVRGYAHHLGLARTMRFELFVATRYLRAKRRQAFIGVITAISIVGVMAGVASLVVALAINNGFRQDSQDRLLGSSAHVQLMRVENDGIRDWQAMLPKLEKMPHVVAAEPAIYDPVMISRGARARGGMVKGIIPSQEKKISDLLSTVKHGSAQELEPKQSEANASPASPDALNRAQSYPPIVLGKDLADTIG